ncbi:HD-GYP domain-containing protein [Anaerosporobacter faecicola]|uniref:HD-GYP domain-containing protein n=1 Tax=Anaerosporobacter faecicola TaxID=2718714 RepID=UPI00143C6D48|nr:HD domain-containing phosphohydrolase [Anaerosporobacter faecicola]
MKKLVLRNNLKEGMIICEDVLTTYGSILVNNGTVVDARVIKLLESNNIYEVRILDTTNEDEKLNGLNTHLKTIRQTRQFKEINQKYSICYSNIQGKFNSVIERDKEVNKREIITDINNILNKADSTRELFDALYGMQLKQNRMYMHSINTALISNIFAKWLKLSEEEVNDITLAGLFHDVGMLLVSEELLEKKKEELTKEEKELIAKHTIYGYRYLMRRELNRQIGLTALTHHEKMDGTGYPLQVMGGALCEFVKIVSIADEYDELTLTEDGARNPFALIKEFEKNGLSKYDPKYIMVFLNGIMDTYMGNDVLLSNGKVGTIIFINKGDLSRPTVKCGDEYINLAEEKDIQILKFV